MIDIESKQNAKFKKWQSLLQAKGIKEESQALLSGEKLIREFIEAHPASARELLLPPKGKPLSSAPAHLKNYRLSKPLFDEIDTIGTHTSVLVVDVEPLSKYSPTPPRGLELVVALSDPGNLGAVLRSAEAFGARRVILTREAASPFLPKALRASSGASFRVPLAQAGPLCEFSGSPSFALDMEGEDLSKFKWPKDLFLILGEEGRGIPDGLSFGKLSIRMQGPTESLNAVVAASIALHAFTSKNSP